jgi:predicted transcriptional regulator
LAGLETSLFARETNSEGRRGAARRSELEVKMDILRVTSEGIDKPTQIMYKANLSWVALLGHLKSLIESGFLREVEYGNRKKYEITQRGSELLDNYQRVVSAVRELPPTEVKF